MIILAFTFLLILGIILGAYYGFVVRSEERDRSNLIRRIGRSGSGTTPLKSGELEKQTKKLSSVHSLNLVLARTHRFSSPLEALVSQSGLNITVGTLILACGFMACVGYVLVKWLTYFTYLGLAAAPFFAMVPYLIVRYVRTRRLEKFEEQFPESIELMARALRAGHTFPTGLQMVSDEMPDPVGSEFKLVYDSQNFGMPLADALKAFAARIPILDARFFVTAVLTQRETGGNLSEVLDNLASVIRDRFKVKRQVRVVTAHGRITGWILAGLPPALAGILCIISPAHMSTLISDPLGIQMIGFAGTLQVIGTLIIRKLVNVPY